MTSLDTTRAGDAPRLNRPEPERDRWDRYVIPHPLTGEKQSWTRCTTFASSIADTYGLSQWQTRMAVLGIARRPDLYAAAATITDPDDKDQRRKLGGVCKDAQEHAGTATGSNLGTALHAWTEQVDAGASPTIPPPWDADVAAYVERMAASGVHVDVDLIERIIVCLEYDVAGTFDRIVEIDGRHYIADLKTGKDLSYGWNEIAVQLAVYAHGHSIYDVATGIHLPMPEVDQERALVMHLPVGKATCDLYWVDIAAGWAMAPVCANVREWRKRKDLATWIEPAGGVTATVMAQLEASVAAPASPERLAWVQARIDAMPAEAKRCLARNWPAGVPTKSEAHLRTDAHVDTLVEVLATVEAEFQLPFPAERDPALVEPPAVPKPVAPLQRPPAPERAPLADAEALIARIEVLPPDLLAEVESTALAKGLPNLRSGNATPDQLAWLTAAVEGAEAVTAERHAAVVKMLDGYDDEAVAEMLYAAVDAAGRGPARLNAWEADRLAVVMAALDDGLLAIVFDDQGARLGAAPALVDALTARHGTRAEVLAAAKGLAEQLERPKPRSVAQVAADPILAAHVASATPANPAA